LDAAPFFGMSAKSLQCPSSSTTKKLIPIPQLSFRPGVYFKRRDKERTMNLKNMLLTLTLGGLMVGSAVAQNPNTAGAGPGVYDPGHPRVNEINGREHNQQNRIANGIKSGELTPHETAKLEKQENKLVRNEKHDMAKDGGHLTAKDQAKLNREANHVSKDIHEDKHNAAVR
jgi:hypothetical protein